MRIKLVKTCLLGYQSWIYGEVVDSRVGGEVLVLRRWYLGSWNGRSLAWGVLVRKLGITLGQGEL